MRKFVRENKNKMRNKAQKSDQGKTSSNIHITVKPSREIVIADAQMEIDASERTEE